MQGRPLNAVVLALLVLSCSCAPPVKDELTLDFADGDGTVIVTAETTFDLAPRDRASRQRVDAAQEAAESETDAWSTRFARLEPEAERITFDRRRGVLERATRSIRIDSADLQQVFADANVTVSLVRADGVTELALYPGSGGRATREQREHFDAALAEWSAAAADYVAAVDHLYSAMASDPDRAKYLFAAILREPAIDGSDPVVLEEEQPLVDGVLAAMERIAALMDEQEESASALAEEADLVANPFEARVVVRLPSAAEDVEGFTRDGDRTLVIEPVDLLATVRSLEGQWLSPDPLAALLRDEPPTAESLAALPRRVTPARAGEIEEGIRERLARPSRFVVRWRD